MKKILAVISLKEIIFGYQELGSYYFCEEGGNNYCGWYFELDSDGTVEIKKFTYNGEEILSEKIFVPLIVVEKIKKILLKNHELIEELPENIFNFSCDGSEHTFNFGEKKISCWNISWHTEKFFDEYDADLLKSVRQENCVLRIFKSIYKLLREYGLVVESYKPFYCEWNLPKVSENNLELIKHDSN